MRGSRAFLLNRLATLAAAAVFIIVIILGHSTSSTATSSWLGNVNVLDLHLDGYGTVYVARPATSDSPDQDFIRSFPEYLAWPLYNEMSAEDAVHIDGDRVALIYLGSNTLYQVWAPTVEYRSFQDFLSQAHVGERASVRSIEPQRVAQVAEALLLSGHKVLGEYNPNRRGFLGLGSSDRMEILEEAKLFYSLAAQFSPGNENVSKALTTVDEYIAARLQHEEADRLANEHRRHFERAVRSGNQEDIQKHGNFLWHAYDLLTSSLRLYPNHESATRLRNDLGAMLSRDYPRVASPASLPIHIREVALGAPTQHPDSVRIERYTTTFEPTTSSIAIEATAFAPEPGTYSLEYHFEHNGKEYRITEDFEVAATGRSTLTRLITAEELPLRPGTWTVTVTAESGNAVDVTFTIKSAEQVRREKIEAQFSAWDGAHHKLTRVIKASMLDPGSFEHVQTTYSDHGSYLIVRTVFRGKNAFGALVVNSVTAKVDLDGNVLEIMEREP